MKLLHQIGDRKYGSNFNNLSEIINCYDVLSFDGIYESVYQNYKHLKGKRIVFFVMGKYVGLDNSFDVGQPLSKYCTWDQVREMAEYLHASIGYHSFSHPDLTKLSDAEVIQEISPPFPMNFFAYPGGVVDARVAKLVQEAGYTEAWSVNQGDGSQFQKKRTYLNW